MVYMRYRCLNQTLSTQSYIDMLMDASTKMIFLLVSIKAFSLLATTMLSHTCTAQRF